METGRNRFFNICEAYQSMLGSGDSVARDARRYRMVNEALIGAGAKHRNIRLTFDEFCKLWDMIYNSISIYKGKANQSAGGRRPSFMNYSVNELLDDVGWEALDHLRHVAAVDVSREYDSPDEVFVEWTKRDEDGDEDDPSSYDTRSMSISELVTSVYNEHWDSDAHKYESTDCIRRGIAVNESRRNDGCRYLVAEIGDDGSPVAASGRNGAYGSQFLEFDSLAEAKRRCSELSEKKGRRCIVTRVCDDGGERVVYRCGSSRRTDESFDSIYSRIFRMADDGSLEWDAIGKACLKNMTEDAIRKMALDNEWIGDDESEARPASMIVLEMLRNGDLGWESFASECLQYMPENKVARMAYVNGWTDEYADDMNESGDGVVPPYDWSDSYPVPPDAVVDFDDDVIESINRFFGREWKGSANGRFSVENGETAMEIVDELKRRGFQGYDIMYALGLIFDVNPDPSTQFTSPHMRRSGFRNDLGESADYSEEDDSAEVAAMDKELKNLDALDSDILAVKELLGWKPVGGVSIVSGSFRPKYGGSDYVPFKPMTLAQFIDSATLWCTAEAHDVVRAETIVVGGQAFLATGYTFRNLLKDDFILNDYPEYFMHDVMLSFTGYNGSLTLVELLHDSMYGHAPFVFEDRKGRDYIASKIVSSYPFLRGYLDNSDTGVVRFSLPPSMAREIQGAADKHSVRHPTLKDLEDEERNYYGTFDSETGQYDTKYNIDVRNAYRDRFGERNGAPAH